MAIREEYMPIWERSHVLKEQLSTDEFSVAGLIDCMSALSYQNAKDSIQHEKKASKLKKMYKEFRSLLPNPNDFEDLAVIGKGQFGTVSLVREQKSRKLYALKTIPKEMIIRNKDSFCFETEREILAKASSEWLTHMDYAFQDNSSLYLVMEYHPGGNLSSLMDRCDGGFSEDATKFYLSEILVGAHALHLMGFVHRDIKPENIMLDRLGHVKLVDFGSAAKLNSKGLITRKMPVGTPEYVAPEILNGLNDEKISYGVACDYWSIGIIAYEMVLASRPFNNECIMQTYSDIMKVQKEIFRSPEFLKLSKYLRSLLKGMICLAEKRLKFEEILKHPFFLDVDWSNLHLKTPPYIPNVSEDNGVSNFEHFPRERSHRRRTLVEAEFKPERDLLFVGFSFGGRELTDKAIGVKSEDEELSNAILELKKKNEELKLEMYKQKSADLERRKSNLHNESMVIQQTYEKESTELRSTVSKLERLLELERTERTNSEQQALKLLTDVRKKWNEREEQRIDGLREDLEKASSKVAKLESKVFALNRENDEAARELSAALDVKKCLKAKLKECKTRLETMIAKYEAKCNEFHELEIRCSQSTEQLSLVKMKNEEIEKIQKELVEREDEVTIANNKMKECHDVICALEEKIKKHFSKMDESKKEMMDAKENFSKKEEAYQNEIEGLKTKCVDRETEIVELKERLKHMTEDASNKADKLHYLENVLSQLEDRLKPLPEIKETKEKECAELQKEIDELKRELSLSKIDIRLTEKKVKDKEDTISYLREMYRDERNKNRDTDKVQTELKEEVKSLKEKLEEANSNAEKYKVTNESLTTKNSELMDRVSELRSFERSSKDVESRHEMATKKIKSLEEQLVELRKSETKCNTLTATCLELDDQIKFYEQKLDNLEAENAKLAETNKALMNEEKNQHGQVTSLKAQINDLKSMMAFKDKQIKDASQKSNEIEQTYMTEEKTWTSKYEELSTVRFKQTETIKEISNQLKTITKQYQEVSEKEEYLEDQNTKLKEECSDLITKMQNLKDSNVKLYSGLEESMDKLAKKNREISEWKNKYENLSHESDVKVHANMETIGQLNKLIDHLQSQEKEPKKKDKSLAHLFQKQSNKENVPSNVVYSYRELQDALNAEKAKCLRLERELNRVKTDSLTKQWKTKSSDLKIPAPKEDEQRRQQHSIPHRFQPQMNMKPTKCAICFGSLHFCRQASVCQYCDLIAHPNCTSSAQDNCGLPKTLASVLSEEPLTTSSSQLIRKGHLRIPEESGRYWKTILAKLEGNTLVLQDETDGKTLEEINLQPKRGFVYIQSSIAYSELRHTTAYDQPHVFKLGYSSDSDHKGVYHFLSKSFTDKAHWIEAIENITLKSRATDDDVTVDKSSDEWKKIAQIPYDLNVFSILNTRDNKHLVLGTSDGLFSCANDVVGMMKNFQKLGDSECVFQMELIPSLKKVVLIAGPKRKLAICDEHELYNCLGESKRTPEAQEIVGIKSCHLFGVGVCFGRVFLCAIDHCKVSILKWDGNSFVVKHKFSTEQPISCIQFTEKSVLVTTHTVYDIDLSDFSVSEFLDDPLIDENNFPIAIFKLSNEEFLICFQEFGIFVNENGKKTEDDITWDHMPGQFVHSNETLWLTYYNAVEGKITKTTAGVKDPSRRMHLCKNPQLFWCAHPDKVFCIEATAKHQFISINQ